MELCKGLSRRTLSGLEIERIEYPELQKNITGTRAIVEGEKIMKSYRETTCEYYSKWLGQDGILCQEFGGIQYLYSNQRNTVQYGYGNRFDIYALCCRDRAVISYGEAAANRLDAMKDAIGGMMAAKEIGRNLERIFCCRASYDIKYVFETMPAVPSEASTALRN